MSTFAWLDHSDEHRQRMLEIVGLFREKGTVDELGIGSVRDTLSEILFPGTSTLHTAAARPVGGGSRADRVVPRIDPDDAFSREWEHYWDWLLTEVVRLRDAIQPEVDAVVAP